jgi:hypothetical protein
MDRFELASARYKDLMANHFGDPGEPRLGSRIAGDRLYVWMEQFVLPLAAEAFSSQYFQHYATWPQRSLQSGSKYEARQLVDEIADALSVSAKLLNRIAASPTIKKEIEKEPGPVKLKGETLFETQLDQLKSYAEKCDLIERRGWSDLVSNDDYFRLSAGMLSACEVAVPPQTPSALVIAPCEANMNLATALGQGRVGDLVSRGLLARISTWVQVLKEFRSMVHRAAKRNTARPLRRLDSEAAAWSRLLTLQDQLKAICTRAPDVPLRESCITLVQVSANFRGAVGLDWLGLDQHLIESQRNYLADLIRSQCDTTTTDCIAAAIADVARLISDEKPNETVEQEAIRGGGLVLIESTHTVYWEGQVLDVNWQGSRTSWDFLWALAKKGQRRSELQMADVNGGLTSASTFSNRWRRLKQELPASLSRHVRPGLEASSYLLALEGEKIHLFPRKLDGASLLVSN